MCILIFSVNLEVLEIDMNQKLFLSSNWFFRDVSYLLKYVNWVSKFISVSKLFAKITINLPVIETYSFIYKG